MGDLVPTASKSVEHLWKPGQSGNPKGRPRTPHDLPAMCREHTPEAVAKLVEIMRSDDHGKALNAIQQLLDRGWGRPVTPIVDETEGTSLTLLHLIAARRVAETLQAVAEGKTENESGDSSKPVVDYSVPALE
jgi:hypothetical protein